MKSFTVIDCQQRSPEWFAARVGRLTGSSAADAIAFRKDKKESEYRAKLRRRLVCERLTGMSADMDDFISKEMQRGIELEEQAGIAYEALTGLMVRWSGFLQHSSLMVGCSLDGYIGEAIIGIVEIKCPKSTTHLSYWQTGGIPDDHLAQVTHNLWVSGAEWCDFVSFDDRFPERLQLFRHRVMRDQVDIAGYEQVALTFLAEVDRDFDALMTPAEQLAKVAGAA